MIIGMDGGETYIASDVPALLRYTRNVCYIGNMEIARPGAGTAVFYNVDQEVIEKEITRVEWDTESTEKSGFEHFMMKEIHELDGFDLIRGYRADDSCFSFARAFVGNAISLEQLSKAMYPGKLGEQIVLRSRRAFGRIRFDGYETADGDMYYLKRRQRDEAARAAWRKLALDPNIDGLFMRDILREKIQPGTGRDASSAGRRTCLPRRGSAAVDFWSHGDSFVSQGGQVCESAGTGSPLTHEPVPLISPVLSFYVKIFYNKRRCVCF